MPRFGHSSSQLSSRLGRSRVYPTFVTLPSIALMTAVMALAGTNAIAQDDDSAGNEPASVAGDVKDCAEERQKTVVRVLVLDLVAGQPSMKASADSLGPIIAREAKRAPGYEIITSGEIRSALSQEAAKQLVGCDDTSCLAEVAEALDADLLVSGRLDLATTPTTDQETGEATEVSAPLLSLSLLNTRAIVTINRVSMAWPGDPVLLPDLARAATQLLIFEKKDRKPGVIMVDGAPESAQVFVDDTEISSSVAVGDSSDVEVGPHRVRVLASGYKTRSEYVLAQAGKTSRVDGTLESEGFSAWWLWGGAGVAVAAGIGATLVFVAATAEAPIAVSHDVALPGYGSLRTQP